MNNWQNGFHIKVKKTARIRNRYNQVPHLSQDTKWESNIITINITNKGQEVSPFPQGIKPGSTVEHQKGENHIQNFYLGRYYAGHTSLNNFLKYSDPLCVNLLLCRCNSIIWASLEDSLVTNDDSNAVLFTISA